MQRAGGNDRAGGKRGQTVQYAGSDAPGPGKSHEYRYEQLGKRADRSGRAKRAGSRGKRKKTRKKDCTSDSPKAPAQTRR